MSIHPDAKIVQADLGRQTSLKTGQCVDILVPNERYSAVSQTPTRSFGAGGVICWSSVLEGWCNVGDGGCEEGDTTQEHVYGRGKRAALGAGSLLVGVYAQQQDQFVTVTKIGTGLSDEQWRSIRERTKGLEVDHRPARVSSLIEPSVWVSPQIVIEVLADEITRSPIHTTGKVGAEPGYAFGGRWFAPEQRHGCDVLLRGMSVRSEIRYGRQNGVPALPASHLSSATLRGVSSCLTCDQHVMSNRTTPSLLSRSGIHRNE